MNEDKLQVAKSKLLKAAALVNQASGIMIKECGGVPMVQDAERMVLSAVNAIDKIVVAEVEK